MGSDAVHDDASVFGQYVENLRHDVLELTAVATDEDGVGCRGDDRVAREGKEFAYVEVDAWGMETAGVFTDDGFALGTDFEGFDVQVGEAEACFDTDASGAGADVPECMTAGQIEGLEGEERYGRLGDHPCAAVEECERAVGYAEGADEGECLLQDDAVGMAVGVGCAHVS